MARAATGMPGWVRFLIGIAIAGVVLAIVLMAMGHGPWQHGAMGPHG